ncbi:8-oxoguanine DNA glycosylase OGG fold protein [Rhodococcoides corynebacterioides]|uniref:Uncharacterized protein n=1 Tax=Rhodococcoides corynebacterioides TaxID=53972 RepID=A0ABS7P7H0_9NOCA|nr:hypothetical protein [Rhodococcus corynebacterioides]MBY6367991.1 hypothetical protein [Rhodococcus corynebacterioides]MBY6409545.1 hypothetical protein [Rhodococcus corynebacterioides]
MVIRGGEPALPEACIRWCGSRSYEVDVLDDMAHVDLEWWNRHLREHRIPVHLPGRSADGAWTDEGHAHLPRRDLRASSRTLRLYGDPELVRLYLCLAWLSGTRDVRRVRRFADVRARGVPSPLTPILDGLAMFRREPALVDVGPHRTWSGWPHTPGVGRVPMSLYAWAVCDDDTAGCPQVVAQDGLSALVRHGWSEKPSIEGLTLTRYHRYCSVLERWARQAGVRPELVELWLVRSWQDRAPTLHDSAQRLMF